MKNEIPKIIHYCWFGGNPLPELAVKCIESWKKFLPEYEIIEWNEKNFDINSCPYVKEAYDAKKFAFVSDYVRLYALCNFGGIYMDTDVEVIKNLDFFLKYQAFSGFESRTRIPTGIMACEKGFLMFKELLEDYDGRHFVDLNGIQDHTTNVATITRLLSKKGFLPNNKFQVINGFALFPNEYFCPKNIDTGEIKITDNTYTIHHFSYSWADEHSKKVRDRKRKIFKIFPSFCAQTVFNFYNHICLFFERMK